MALDTHRVHWQVTHSNGEEEPREFVSLPKALRFIRDESALSSGQSTDTVELITDDTTVATFSTDNEGVQISDDAISLVKDAWTALDDD